MNRALLVVAGIAVWGACGGTPPAVTAADVAAIVGDTKAPGVPGATSPANYLVVTAHVCLRCRDVGWVIRRLRNDTSRRFAVLTKRTEVADVQAYLRRERAEVHVVGVDTELLSHPTFLDSLVLVSVDSGDALVSYAVSYKAEGLITAARRTQ